MAAQFSSPGAADGVFAESWGDVCARILLSAALIVATIPTLFFLVISDSEIKLITSTFNRYIASRCALLRPWIPQSIKTKEALAISSTINMNQHAIDRKNAYLRYLAFASSIIVMCVLASLSMAVWFYAAKQPLYYLMLRSFFYVLAFIVIELAYISIVSSMPLIDLQIIDRILVDGLIAAGKSCGLALAPRGP